MRKMKLFLAVILGAFALFSCSDDDDTPSVSFDSANYLLMANEDLNVNVKLSEPAKSDIEIPLTFTGDAVQGTDYIVSTEKLTVKAGSTTAKLVISPRENYDEGKSIIISLGTVAGYEFGKNQVATISVTSKEKMIYSFKKDYSLLESKLDVEIELYDSKGDKINISKDIVIPFVFDQTIDNAAEKGTHFTVKDDIAEFVVKAGTNVGKITLNYLSNDNRDSKMIKITIPDTQSKFRKGSIDFMQIKILGSTKDLIAGTWECTGTANFDWLKSEVVNNWFKPQSDVENMPEDVVGEKITFEVGETNNMVINMTKDLANYFRNCNMESIGLETFVYADKGLRNNRSNLEVYKLSQANVNFSSEQETLREVEVGFRVTEIEKEEVLEVVIYDMEPVGFYDKLYLDFQNPDWGETPFKDYSMSLRYNFKRVTEE